MKDLADIRKEIDRLDDRISRLFAERMELSLEAAKYKEANNLPILDTSRELGILARVTENLDEGMAVYVKALFTAMFEASRSYQSRFWSRGEK